MTNITPPFISASPSSSIAQMSSETGSESPSRYIDEITGGLSSEQVVDNTSRSSKRLRFQLQKVGKSILIDSTFSRFRRCYSYSLAWVLEILHSGTSGKAYYSGLDTCGSVWVCPVCAPKIAGERCKDLEQGIRNHLSKSPDNDVVMLSLTNHHRRYDVLEDMLSCRSEASISFFGQWGVKEALKGVGYIGRVSSFEITYSKLNGWHPHTHILLFLNKKLDKEGQIALKEKLSPYWLKALEDNDLSGSSDIALNVTGGCSAGEYINGMAMEMTLSIAKKGHKMSQRIPHYSPFQLLDYIQLNGNSGESVAWAKRAFHEYALAMKGRRALVYSDGLKAYLGLKDMTDQEAAQPLETDLQEYARFHSKYFKILRSSVHLHDEDKRGVALSIAEKYGKEALHRYLESLGVKLIKAPVHEYFKDEFSEHGKSPSEQGAPDCVTACPSTIRAPALLLQKQMLEEHLNKTNERADHGQT